MIVKYSYMSSFIYFPSCLYHSFKFLIWVNLGLQLNSARKIRNGIYQMLQRYKFFPMAQFHCNISSLVYFYICTVFLGICQLEAYYRLLNFILWFMDGALPLQRWQQNRVYLFYFVTSSVIEFSFFFFVPIVIQIFIIPNDGTRRPLFFCISSSLNTSNFFYTLLLKIISQVMSIKCKRETIEFKYCYI